MMTRTRILVMTIELFRIVLDRSVQHSGQLITGKVELWNTKKLTSKGLYLTIKGGAKCSWTELRPVDEYESKYTIVFFTGTEDYLDERLVLVHLKGEGVFTIPPGRHEYPFEFLLPRHLPSTFENGTYGNIRYAIRAVLERKWRPDNQCEVPLFVNTVVDLNAVPTATMKPSAMGSKSVNHTSGPVVAKVWLDRAGYVPGENILFNAEIKNLSDHEMAGSSVQLIEHRVYQVLHPKFETKKEDRKLAEMQRTSFVAGDKWDQVAIRIPPLAPVLYCGIISVEHRIEFRVDLGNASELVVTMNITIGNVALRTEQTTEAQCSKAEEAEKALEYFAEPPTNRTEEIPPPPSYDECTAVDEACALSMQKP